MSTSPVQPPPLSGEPEDGDFISLAPLWHFVRRYRNWLELGLFALLTMAAGILAASSLVLPIKLQAGLEFTLTFQDAALGTYPNRQPFQTEDLLETSLLQSVYEANFLAPYIKFDEFKAGFSIERAGNELELLRLDYRARLDDRKLTLADREKIETQFRNQLKMVPPINYRLNFIQTARPARLIPPALLTKAIEDILRKWSDDAVLQKKVMAYAARIPGIMSLPKQRSDTLIAMMELEERTRTLADGLAELTRMPGGYQASLDNGTRLVDLLLRLDSLQENRIPQIRAALFGNISDPIQAAEIERAYRLQTRMREDLLNLSREKLDSAVSTYRDYLASRPEVNSSGTLGNDSSRSGAGTGTQLQIGDTFLVKLMELGRVNDDTPYQTSLVEKIRNGRLDLAEDEAALRETQDIVLGLQDVMRASREKMAASAKGKVTVQELGGNSLDFGALLLQGCRELNQLIADTERLHLAITQNHLSPQTSLYRITVPVFMDRSSLLVPRNAGLFVVLFIFLGLGLILVVCWVHDQSSKPQA